MKRRRFCRYIVFSSIAFGGVGGINLSNQPISQSLEIQSSYQWVVLYWMPYDNDLVSFGESIIQSLSHSSQSPKIAVVVQSDYQGDRQMRRRQLNQGVIKEFEVKEEDSSSVSNFSAYLDWANKTFKAQNWAIIIVGHGGKLNEISPDDHGLDFPSRTWMKVEKLADSISQFKQVIQGNLEFIFFQNCNKATLEVIYEMRNCAHYTLASQLLLGAPNDYYQDFFRYLSQSPSIGGKEAAIALINSESKKMYNNLTLVDNQVVNNLPTKLSPLIEVLLLEPLATGGILRIPTYQYSGEKYADLMLLLNQLVKKSDRGYRELEEFADFLKSEVIVYYRSGGQLGGNRTNLDLNQLCGLGLYIPNFPKDISRYANLSLYQDVDLLSLYRSLFT